MNDNTSIKMSNISKAYRMYDSNRERVLDALNFNKKRYGHDFFALKDINIDVKKGDIVGIVGANGSGKSTLLKIIAGVLNQTDGTCEVNGKISALLELGAGFNPEYSGIDNIYFSGMIMGFSRKQMEEKLDDIIKFADIGDHIYQPVKSYSSGMYVRLAYSVAVAIEPDILIVDEALSVGDAHFQMKSLSKMQSLFKKGKTVLFVSHDTASVKSMCTSAIYLDKGRIVAQGEVKEVVEMYEADARKKMDAKEETYIIKALPSGEEIISDDLEKACDEIFVVDEAFNDRVSYSREGDGEAKVVGLQLLDQNSKPISDVSFNQECKLRMFIEFYSKASVCVGYHIRDDRNIFILGSNTIIEEIGIVSGDSKDRVMVEFTMKLPLMHGRYNIMTVLSKNNNNDGSTSKFVDITKDGFYFNVLIKEGVRVWNKVQLKNNINITKFE